MKPAWVYILECSDSSYYTGSTTQLETRISEHQLGVYDSYTARRRPLKLRWSSDFPDISQAIAVERQIKGWSRKKKEALINGDFTLLHELAQCQNESHYKKRTQETPSR